MQIYPRLVRLSIDILQVLEHCFGQIGVKYRLD